MPRSPSPHASPPRRRRRLRVSLRGLMILVALVGVPAGWAIATIRGQRQAINAIQAAGGEIGYDYQAEKLIIPGTKIVTTLTAPAARWLRRRLGDELFQSVRSVSFPKLESPAVLAFLARFDRLESLVVRGTSGPGIGYEALGRLPRLRTLTLRGAGITDSTLGEVAAVGSLDRLWLMDVGATDAGLVRLARLPNLDDLTLTTNAHFTDAGVARLLGGLPRLRTFELRMTAQPAHATLAALARHHPALQALRLEWCALTEADCAAIGRLAQLRQLDLNGAGLTDAGLAHLGTLANLVKLNIAHAAVSDAGLIHLGRLGRLQDLDASFSEITDLSLPLLGSISTLRRLHVSETGVTSARLSGLLATSPRLTILNLFAPNLTRPRVAPTASGGH